MSNYNFTLTLKNRLVIVSANIRSCGKNFDSLLASLQSRSINFHILILCETWLNAKSDALHAIEGYKFIQVNRNNRRGGGLRIYIQENIEAIKIDDLSGIYDTHEALFVKVPVSRTFSFSIGCIYRPPNCSISAFNEYLEEILLTNPSIINIKCVIMGDFNIRINETDNYALPYSHKNFINIMEENNFIQYVNEPTHCDAEGVPDSLIDLSFCNFFRECKAQVLDECITDHFPIVFSF